MDNNVPHLPRAADSAQMNLRIATGLSLPTILEHTAEVLVFIGNLLQVIDERMNVLAPLTNPEKAKLVKQWVKDPLDTAIPLPVAFEWVDDLFIEHALPRILEELFDKMWPGDEISIRMHGLGLEDDLSYKTRFLRSTFAGAVVTHDPGDGA